MPAPEGFVVKVEGERVVVELEDRTASGNVWPSSRKEMTSEEALDAADAVIQAVRVAGGLDA